MASFDDFFLAFVWRELDTLTSQQLTAALQPGNAIAFQQAGNAACELVDYFVFARQHGGNINFHFTSADAVIFVTGLQVMIFV